MSNPIGTAWEWIKTAPLPVVLVLILVVSGWVRALDDRVSSQELRIALLESRLSRIDTNLQTLLEAVLWEQATRNQPPRKEKK